MTELIDWSGDTPRSQRFDDIYFNPEDGLAESQAVFLQGCGLPDGWAGRSRFVVGELGFGSGLNILALVDLWRRTRPAPSATLHVFSIEAYPMSAEDAARALAAWPELAEIASPLLASWPKGRRGFHRVEWPNEGVILDLAINEAEPALAAWSGSADAWFLDGFAPSKNPEMWRPEVMALIAARSALGARAATFSVAGMVRRGLQGAGFAINRAPGFGRKKERLEARAPGEAARTDASPPRVAVIGAGIAGATLARAFLRLGVIASVFDGQGVGAGASGNAAALVTPRLDAGLGSNAELHAQAFTRSVGIYRLETPAAIIAEGALQLQTQPRDAGRFQKIIGWDGFDPGSLRLFDAETTAEGLDEESAPLAVHLLDALVIDPLEALQTWLPEGFVGAQVHRLERRNQSWSILDAQGDVVGEAEVVCLAGGPASARLAALPLRPVRGQVSLSRSTLFTGTAASWSGYAVPLQEGVLFGATHDRDDWGEEPRAEDDQRNVQRLNEGRPELAARISQEGLESRASLRAMTPDYLPLAGGVADEPGLFVLSGLGGRGFALAPLLAEALAAQVLGAPSPLPALLRKIIDPRRFSQR